MNKTYLIAGGTSGIGLASANQLASQGHQVLCACRHPENLPANPLISGTPFDATTPTVDIALPEQLDGLVYCPGTITLKPFHRLSDEDFLNDFQINLLGAARLIRHALPALKKNGQASVVLFSTVAAQRGLSFHASISAAKAGVEGLTRSLAAELAPKIRVNCIAPSLTDTPLAAGLLGSEEKRERSSKHHPLQRVGSSEETAELVSYLLSNQSGFMTGQIIGLDGGLSTIQAL